MYDELLDNIRVCYHEPFKICNLINLQAVQHHQCLSQKLIPRNCFRHISSQNHWICEVIKDHSVQTSQLKQVILEHIVQTYIWIALECFKIYQNQGKNWGWIQNHEKQLSDQRILRKVKPRISTKEESQHHQLYKLISIHNVYVCSALDTHCKNQKTTSKNRMRYSKISDIKNILLCIMDP